MSKISDLTGTSKVFASILDLLGEIKSVLTTKLTNIQNSVDLLKEETTGAITLLKATLFLKLEEIKLEVSANTSTFDTRAGEIKTTLEVGVSDIITSLDTGFSGIPTNEALESELATLRAEVVAELGTIAENLLAKPTK